MALRDERGNIVSGGLFAVPHKTETDRVILDRRPMNELEKRVVMAKLPHGSLFTQIILPKNSSIRASGDDLSNYFYLLKHHEEWLGRNTIGSPVKGRDFVDLGCDPKKEYMLSFRVIAMGDTNAVDLAQETHLQILQDAGCMRADETVAFKKRLPAKPTWEGLYMDDHVVTQIVPKRKIRGKEQRFRDEEIVEASRDQYRSLGIPTSSKKRFTKLHDFVSWGTSVCSQSGRVGTPLVKLKQLSHLITEVCKLGWVTQKLMQKVVGLVVHPCMHKRAFMCLLQDTYVWIEKFSPKERKRMPNNVREELLWITLCLPLMHSNIRWPISTRIGASDALCDRGGRAATSTLQPLPQTLYRYSEHVGESVRLDWTGGSLVPPSCMSSPPEELEQLMLAHVWNTTHMCRFGHKQHINILELKMVKAELIDLVSTFRDPMRAVLLVDSRVVVGAFSKGRSSSRQMNRVLRSMLGWAVAGEKSLRLVWVASKSNPSDHPSRGRKIPEPVPDDPVVERALGKKVPELQVRKSNRKIFKRTLEGLDSIPCEDRTIEPRHPAEALWSFKEIFAGKGRLTHVFKDKSRFKILPAVELIQRGKPSPTHDLLCDSIFVRLCKDAKNPKQIWHFGLPCSSFSLLQNMNKGTRTTDRPQGDGSLDRENQGNELLFRTLYLCELLHAHGSFFTIENPQTSYVWKMPQLLRVSEKTGAQKVVFDQCQYGFKIPDSSHIAGPAKKGTIFWGTLTGLERLERRCCGEHRHVQVIGGVKTRQGWVRRSELAGAYPHQLCSAYHRCCERLFE